MPRSPRLFSVHFVAAAIIAVALVGCAAQSQMPYHGFDTQAALDSKDAYVTKESVGGKLDPKNLATEDQKYIHDGIYYDRYEEGYYQWGKQMYQLGYRDIFYVEDIAPRAFRHELVDTYMDAIKKGYNDALDQASAK